MRSTKLTLIITAVSVLCIGAAVTFANPLLPRLLAAEKAGLQFTVEEEKLAYDVYSKMKSLWGARTRTFANIRNSEATHISSVRALLKANSLPDPTAGKKAGVFANTDLRKLYRTLVAKGSRSLKDALQVGVSIEEKDIADLSRLIGQTNDAAIKRVYWNLREASKNHLAAFKRALGSQKATAPIFPRLLDVEKAGLLFSVEEEKLAFDVYSNMNSLWGSQTQTFGNILKSEANHADAVRTQLAANGIPDPTVGKAAGVYVDSSLQILYNDLMEKGKLSVRDALEVGVIVEETDIDDLNRLMADTTDAAILRVYGNLKAGSESHLVAFNRALGLLGSPTTTGTSIEAPTKTPATVSATQKPFVPPPEPSPSSSPTTSTSFPTPISVPASAEGPNGWRLAHALVPALLMALFI
jgi:hypothetical protein